MVFTKEQKSGKVLLKIREELSVYHVATLREKLLDCISTHGDMELDLSEVTGCDAAGLQLLCAARKCTEQRMKSFRVVKTSSAISAAIETAGLNSADVLGESRHG